MLEKFFITCEQENHWTLTDSARADDKIISLKDEYEKFWQKILRGENFAFPRYGDGEFGIMLGKEMHGVDNRAAPFVVDNLEESHLHHL